MTAISRANYVVMPCAVFAKFIGDVGGRLITSRYRDSMASKDDAIHRCPTVNITDPWVSDINHNEDRVLILII
jgi:hypothetical protein